MSVRSIVQEFKDFIMRGNVMDLAVGVIIGGAFTSIVNALVNDVVNPLISFVAGGSTEVPGLSITLGGNVVDFGAFLGACIHFLITAAVIFALVKALNTLNRVKEVAARKTGLEKLAAEKAAPQPRTCPYCKQEIPDGATRCPHCTSKLEGYENPLDGPAA